MKKISELSYQEKRIINNAIFFIIIIYLIFFSFKAYNIYKEQGFGYCLEIEESKETKKYCFNSSKERNSFLENLSLSWANNLDYNYINDYNYTINVD